MLETKYYRFPINEFVEAANFEEAKAKLIAEIEAHIEKKKNWHSCTCLGLNHRPNCSQFVLPY